MVLLALEGGVLSCGCSVESIFRNLSGILQDGRAQRPVLFDQLPPSVRYTPEMLQSILSQLDCRRRNVIEFRHKSWWNDEVFEAFNAAGVIFCSCSGPRLPDELVRTADDIYVRFHGIRQWYRHDYSDAELLVWVERIRQSRAKTVWAYFNNDRDGHSIKNANRLSELMSISAT
ncbi:DUF72 domain-containing protein [Rhizobium leguminosarum]|uniref:DUF72 domain-containing protein n=1 Tax=Rhizobium leguminosarum TaxID=384 RepID=UPI001FE16C54|nr:DUF72 domain-containing protein [Rhizobium leguminosarum]